MSAVSQIDKPMSPREGQRLHKQLRTQFVRELADYLSRAGVPTCELAYAQRVIWRDPGRAVGVGTLKIYDAPSTKDSSEPLVLRVHLGGGCEFYDIDPMALKAIGLPRDKGDMREPKHLPRQLELSLLPDEVQLFVPWVAAWIHARQELHGGNAPAEVYAAARIVLDQPPVPFERLLGDIREANYLWTTTAVAVHDAWAKKKQERKAAHLARVRPAVDETMPMTTPSQT
jgi:hypothetical protein